MKKQLIQRIALSALCVFGIALTVVYYPVNAQEKQQETVTITMSKDDYAKVKEVISGIPQVVMESKNIPASFAVEVFKLQQNQSYSVTQFLDSKVVKPAKK